MELQIQVNYVIYYLENTVWKTQQTLDESLKEFLLFSKQWVLFLDELYYFQDICIMFTLEKWFFALFNPQLYYLHFNFHSTEAKVRISAG